MDMDFERVDVPRDGEKIDVEGGELVVPEKPLIPFIMGDGIGVDTTPATKTVLDAAAESTGREIRWMELYAGEKANGIYDEHLPDETIEALKEMKVGLKGPLTTPVGSGFRSLNVAIRKKLDLYACVRPVFHLDGVPSPVKNPEEMDMVIFRENTEDVYSGIEWRKGTGKAGKVRKFLEEEMGEEVSPDSGIGIKPISERKTKRLVRKP